MQRDFHVKHNTKRKKMDNTDRRSSAAKKVIRSLESHPLRAAGILALTAAACIAAGCLAVPEKPGQIPAGTPETEAAVRSSMSELNSQDSLQNNTAAVSEKAAEEQRSYGLIIIPPGGKVPATDLDVLFIHAHPDDESLDFGCLMALTAASGLRTGLVTFTDGESGLDLFPGRPLNGIYPDHYLKGRELAEVRSTELEAAALKLGVDLLVRLGLENHPYNSIKDELPPAEIIDEWGGKSEITEKLRQIILLTKPETIVAPEGPGKAREHFEHEAVGFIVAETLKSFEPDDYRAPKRYITSVDPRQQHLYPEAKEINAGIRVKNADGKERSLRELQLEALMNHRTQNDAVNVGTGFLPKYPAEYYKIQYWRSNRSWDNLLQSGLY